MESSGTILRHSGFFKQRMQYYHFQHFNVTSQRGKEKKNPVLCIWADCSVSRSFSVLQQGQMAGGSCHLVRKHEGLVVKRNARVRAWCVCVCVCVWCALWGSAGNGALFMDLCWAPESSVQSQQRLGVLTFPCIFVFQRAGFHHRLGPECTKTHMLKHTMTAAEALTSLGSPCFFLSSLL